MVHTGRTGAAPGRQKERLRAAVEPVVAAAGFDLEDLVVTRAGRSSVVRVVVDSDQGAGSDAIADISRDVSAALDAAEDADGALTPGGYTLEVTSPGVDRPLTQPRHWKRNRGRLVKVRVGPASRTGRVLDADDAGIRLDVDGEQLEVSYPELGPGSVQIEFGRPKPRRTSDDGNEGASRPGKEEG